MFNFLKKKPTTWIDQPVIDYLMGISPAYAIYYTVRMGGQNLQLQFRNNEGKFLADIHENRVQSICVTYQHLYNPRSLGVKQWPISPNIEKSNPSRNLRLHINSIDPEARERLLRFLSRLDNECVLTELRIYIDNATEEEICSTQTELDMLEMEEEEEV